VGATIGHAEHSGDLRRFIEGGKKIIITTVQKFPFILDEIGKRARQARFAILIDEAHSSQGGKTSAAMSRALAGQEARRRGDHRGPDQPDHGGRKLLQERELLRVHRHPEEQDAGDLRRRDPGRVTTTGAPKRRAFHSYTMKQAIDEGFILDVLRYLHAGEELLQAREDGRERPGVRQQEGREEAAPLRRGPRARDPAQGRDHGRPLPRAGARAEQGRRQGPRDGGLQRHRARHPVLHGLPRLPGRTQEPLPAIVAFSGEHEVGGKKETEASAQRLPFERDPGPHPGGSLPVPDLRGQVPDRLRRAAAAHDVRRQDPRRRQGGADAVAAQPGAPAEARRVRARLHERDRGHPRVLRALLPDHRALRRDGREQAARPEGPTRRAQVYDASQVDELVERYLGRRTETARSDPRRLRGRSTRTSTRTARSTSRARPRRSPAPTRSCRPSCRTRTPSGRSSRSS
jgi:hypothetical protein